MAGKVLIRKLRDYAEFEYLLHIQRTVWNHSDVNLTPAHQFCVHSRMGAILLGAFVDGKMAGFVYSFPAIYDGGFCQHSHMLAVVPEFQGYGIGKKLKWALWREALKQGIGLITWTYDPLQAKNANLNLHALGVRSRTYFQDFYGPTPSLCIGPGIPTDRLLVEWLLGEGRVLDRQKGMGVKDEKRGGGRTRRDAPLDPGAMPKALERGETKGGPFPMPTPPKMNIRERVILVEIPPDLNALKPFPEVIASWQTGLRRVMPSYFKRGYAADDFLFGERCYYVLKK
ncbi:MAG: GNAT family N-acetyltransferase [Candidatus Aminicenantes bacterium]|nr:GNAT family N-acetyltransferase [Candidatus Aminicenantes bacterium]